MAHTKSQKASKGNRDSIAKRLGVKLSGGQKAKAGNVIIRQRGMTYIPGDNTYMGKDYTIHAKADGTVKFFDKKGRKHVSVVTS